MKHEIPKFIVITTLLAAVAVGTLFVLRAGGTSEIAGPKIEVGSQAVPDYLLDKMSPEMQAKVRQQSAEQGVVTERATQKSSQAPSAPTN